MDVTPQQIDLSLTKTVNNANAAVGTDVTFTITVANAAGVSNATGVVVDRSVARRLHVCFRHSVAGNV